jgi:hypothetical protein
MGSGTYVSGHDKSFGCIDRENQVCNGSEAFAGRPAGKQVAHTYG